MSRPDDEPGHGNEQVVTEFLNTLNRHGYAFQYAVLCAAKRLYEQNRSDFYFEVSEFPVRVQGVPTRIDFVLRHREKPLRLVCECKRANPAVSNWCFVRAPFVRRDSAGDRVLVEHARVTEESQVEVGAFPSNRSDRTYHVGFEVKSQTKGDPSGSKSGIEDAATQVCRGMNGLIDYLLRDFTPLQNQAAMRFVPVIFTTANLWVSDTNLQRTDLTTGELASEYVNLTRTDWLWYQYHTSPGIKYESDSRLAAGELGDALDREFVRSIAVVTADGIRNFLRWAMWL